MMALNAEHLPQVCPETPHSLCGSRVAKYHKSKSRACDPAFYFTTTEAIQ
jgi:hypothetical protein